MQISREFVERAIGPTVWDFGNSVLYDLCKNHPRHDQDSTIIAKIWLIGRSYAAAIERRLNVAKMPVGDGFYEDNVAPTVRASKIDAWFDSITETVSTEKYLEIHAKVTKLFSDISGMQKRSLASKYLHFHFPQHFYIFDSRACNALRQLAKPVRRRHAGQYDRDYAAFCSRCESLNDQVARLLGRRLTPRELDKVLLTLTGREDR